MSFIDFLKRELCLFLEPIGSPNVLLALLADYRGDVPTGLDRNDGFISSIADLQGRLRVVSENIEALRTGSSDFSIDNFAEVFSGLDRLDGTSVDLPPNLHADLLDALLCYYFQTWHRTTYAVLSLAGILRISRQPDGEGLIKWSKFGDFLQDPAGTVLAEYRLATASPHEIATRLFPIIQMACEGFPILVWSGSVRPGSRFLRAELGYGGAIVELETTAGSNAVAFSLSDEETFTSTGGMPIVEIAARGAGRVVVEGERIDVMAPMSVSTSVRWNAEPRGSRVVIGRPERSRLESEEISLAARVDASTRGISAVIRASFRRGRVVLDRRDLDGFLQSVLSDVAVDVDATLIVDKTGFKFEGSGGLEVRLSRRIELTSNVWLNDCRLKVNTDDGLELRATTDPQIRLGPVICGVSSIGMSFGLAPAPGNGALGTIAVQLGFVPPSGANFSVYAAGVSGGGFLRYDKDAGRYLGALELTIFSVGIRAIGVVDSRLPGGVSGYSFLIVISADFTPIQLGLGFTLRGVGGLCGVQRSVVPQALQAGLRSGTLAPLLFARNPLERASELVTGLNTVFPPVRDRYVFGPLFRLGWGTPTMVTALIGVVIQFPAPLTFILLGTLHAALPSEDLATVVLNLDVVGLVEPDEERLSIDASLRDSRIVRIPLAGAFALRLSWGATPEFLVSLGGFHPRFRAPAGFPTLARLSLTINFSERARLLLEAYFALTSNTLQIGANAQLTARAVGAVFEGQLRFDALLTFSPFSFRIDFAAGLSIRYGSLRLLAIRVEGTIEGPTPWRISGRASISVLLFDVNVGFDVSFGSPDERRELSAAAPAPLTVLVAALQDARNWSPELPAGTERVVVLGSTGGADAPIFVDPVGGLVVRQKVVPLHHRISRFAETRLAAPFTAAVRSVALMVGESRIPIVAPKPVRDQFAPGQFEVLSDDARLTRPSFELMDAGVSLSSEVVRVGEVLPAPVEFTLFAIESDERDPEPRGMAALSESHLTFAMAHAGSLLARRAGAGLDSFKDGPGQAPKLHLAEERFFVGRATTWQAPTELSGEGDASQMFERRDAWEAMHPEDVAAFVVLSAFELRRSA